MSTRVDEREGKVGVSAVTIEQSEKWTAENVRKAQALLVFSPTLKAMWAMRI